MMMMTMMNTPSLPSRRRLGLAATAIAGTIAAVLTLRQHAGHLLDASSSSSPRKLSSPLPSSIINVPYGPHDTTSIDKFIDERSDAAHRQLTIWRPRDNGSIMCKMARTKGPNMIDPDANYQNTIVVGYPGADKRTVRSDFI